MTAESHPLRAADAFDADATRVFRALSDADRRFLVAVLAERSGETALEELATELAAWRGDGDDGTSVETTHATLYHTHVPKLADAGVLDHDRERGVVRLAADADAVREWLTLPDLEG
ncbi:DUF7344 domain-containing protein [Halosimplex salinum]|uniref:DUF7344 domain-containing protein n=1 Tax=Halosimplex salinum TaxID=1710538 RepID=UPI000F460D72|nr:hypothetical protein [Halosimplex salinum]